ncbi:MAG: hypothetical protein ABW148_16470 [Sedimenticola sp.]
MSKIIELNLTEEFIEWCNAEGSTPESLLKTFMSDMCEMDHYDNLCDKEGSNADRHGGRSEGG